MAPQKRKCSGKNSRGKPCGNYAIKGGTVCSSHGGGAPQVKAKAAVRAEVMNWGLGDSTIDPGDTCSAWSASQLLEPSGTPPNSKRW
jgi:hypothetical protein